MKHEKLPRMDVISRSYTHVNQVFKEIGNVPKEVYEIGSGHGGSTFFFAENCSKLRADRTNLQLMSNYNHDGATMRYDKKFNNEMLYCDVYPAKRLNLNFS